MTRQIFYTLAAVALSGVMLSACLSLLFGGLWLVARGDPWLGALALAAFAAWILAAAPRKQNGLIDNYGP